MRLLRPFVLVTLAACGGSALTVGEGDGGSDAAVPPDGATATDAAFDTASDGACCDAGSDAPSVVDSEVVDADADADADAGDAADAAPPCVLGTSVFTDIYAGQPANSGWRPSAVLDEANGKLLVVTDNQANGGRPSLFRCRVDGSACMHTDISTGLVAAGVPSAVIDAANGKLLAVSNVGGKPGLFRCNLDGTGCAFVDISAGRGGGSGSSPSAVFDAVNGKLLVATTDGTNMACRPAIFRCNADGTGCVYSTPPDQGCATAPSAVIDPTNGRLLVATSNNSFLDASYLVRCNVDGSGCLYTTMGVGPSQALNPSAVVDLANAKLLVAGTRSYMGGSRPSLIRCELNGTGCLLLDISAGQPAQSGLLPSAVVDAANGKLLVVTQDGASGNKPALFRCNLDGTACTYTDISAGQGNGSGSRPSAVLDAANGKLLVATDTGLFSVCVR